MPTLNIEGQHVKVDDSFSQLSPEDQHAAVDSIAQKLKISAPQTGQNPDDRGFIGNALKPITNYPETYSKMRNEAQDQMSRGVGQIAHPSGVMDVAKGAGNVALGAAGFVGSPVNAAIDTVVGQPIEENTGIPRGITDTAASLALPIPKSLPSLGMRVGSGAAKTAEQAAPTIEELDKAAKAGFQHPEVGQLSIKPKALQSWADDLRSNLTEAGLDENIAPKTWNILKRFDEAPPNSVVTGNNLQSLRRTFGRAAADPNDAPAASRAIESLDKFVGEGIPQDAVLRGDPNTVGSIWGEARGNYAAARRSERISTAIDKAELQAGGANSGANIDNATRQQIKSILNNRKARRGYSGDELREMRQIVMGTYTGDAARAVGNILGGGGGLGTMLTAGAGAASGAMAGGPFGAIIGAATPIVGFGFKKLGNAITGSSVEKLDELVRSRSPLAKQMLPPIQKWGEAVSSYQGSPTPRNIAKLMLASRNLSNNLADAGIVTSAEKLISSLQGSEEASAKGDRLPGPNLGPIQPPQ
jgi:hypothetical protein